MKLVGKKEYVNGYKYLVYLVDVGEEEKKFFSGAYDRQRLALPEFLQKVFRVHKNIYETMKFQYGGAHHPDHSNFSEQCDGFELFLKQMFNINKVCYLNEKQLQEILAAAARYIQERSRRMGYSFPVTADVAVSVVEEEPTPFMPLLPMFMDSYLATSEGIFRIQLNKTEAESIDELRERVIQSLKSSYEAEIKARTKVLENTVQELQEKIKKLRFDTFVEGLKAFQDLQEQGWKIEDNKLVYTGKIVADKLKSYNKIVEVKDSPFYVENIAIKIEPTLQSAYALDSYHPNVRIDGEICLGDLEGLPLAEGIEKIIKVLQICNLSSAFPNDAADRAEKLFHTMSHTGEVWEA